jgi:hypothetical protein
MLQPAVVDIYADRWVPFRRDVPFVGYNFTGASAFAMQIRLTPDAAGSPLLSLSKVTSDIQGVRLIYGGLDTVANHIAAARIPEAPPGYGSADSVLVSLLGIRIDETVMEGLPLPAERGDYVTLAWDLHITPSGGFKDKYAGGNFVVRSGATEN